MALVAEEGARMISARTKAALAAAKARGVDLGGARAGAADRARQVPERGPAARRAHHRNPGSTVQLPRKRRLRPAPRI